MFGHKGWFRNPCYGEMYDLTGRCFAGPCVRGMDRYPVAIDGGNVRVDVAHQILGPAIGPEKASCEYRSYTLWCQPSTLGDPPVNPPR